MVADELMAADRAFSAAGANADLITSLSAMFAENVTVPTPPGRVAKGKAEAVAALKANPANAQSKAVWTPVRVGVSADGLHGFTFGVMSIKRGDGANAPAKYLAYWVKGADGWRVVAYKRVGRAEGQVPSDLIAPALPMQMAKPVTDVAAVEQHRTSLIASSGDLGVTFGFIKPNSPAPNAAAAGATAGIPFFTIWRRAGPNAPWRYVAE